MAYGVRHHRRVRRSRPHHLSRGAPARVDRAGFSVSAPTRRHRPVDPATIRRCRGLHSAERSSPWCGDRRHDRRCRGHQPAASTRRRPPPHRTLGGPRHRHGGRSCRMTNRGTVTGCRRDDFRSQGLGSFPRCSDLLLFCRRGRHRRWSADIRHRLHARCCGVHRQGLVRCTTHRHVTPRRRTRELEIIGDPWGGPRRQHDASMQGNILTVHDNRRETWSARVPASSTRSTRWR